jgi:hypothetical protein
VLTKNNVPDDEVNKMTFENAMRWYHWDPFGHIPREQATVGALRKAAEGHDVSIRALSPQGEDGRDLRRFRRERQGADRQYGLSRSFKCQVRRCGRTLSHRRTRLYAVDVVEECDMSGGMSFELTEDQELIRKSVAELAGKFDDPLLDGEGPGARIPPGVLRRHRQGWLARHDHPGGIRRPRPRHHRGDPAARGDLAVRRGDERRQCYSPCRSSACNPSSNTAPTN